MEAEIARQTLLSLIQEVAGLDQPPALDPAKPIREQIELDSMDFLDIVLGLRKKYKIALPEADFPQLLTLDSSVAYLVGHVP